MSDSIAKEFGEGLILGNAFSAAGSTAAAAGTIRQMGDELIDLDKKVSDANLRADKAEAKVSQLKKENESLRKQVESLEKRHQEDITSAMNRAAIDNAFNSSSKDATILAQARVINELKEELLVSQNDFLEFFTRNDAKSKLIKKKIKEGALVEGDVEQELKNNILQLAEDKPEVKNTGSFRLATKNTQNK